MTRIAAVHPVLAPYRYPQPALTEAFAELSELPDSSMLERLHRSAKVESRHLALPLEEYAKLRDFDTANQAYISSALDLGEQAITGALTAAGVRPDQVDLLLCTSVTGLAVPSIDARLANLLRMRADVKRLPLFGLGCVGGAAGIARAHDYLRAWPTHTVVLLAVELCSLTLQRGDPSTANLVASALFGDGAAAVVLRGAAAADLGPHVAATRSVLYPSTERVMGWDIGSTGFRVVLGADVPDVIGRHLNSDLSAFLADHGLETSDIAAWISHPGGPKVLEALASALELPPGALDLTWQSLARIGNLSSASVLHVLRDTLDVRQLPSGSPAVLLAMGPGFCSELVLLRW